MKKKFLSVLAAMLVLPLSLSAQTDYQKTMSHVDQGGISLNYTDCSLMIKSLRDAVISVPAQGIKQTPEAAMLGAVLDDIMRELGVYDLGGMAVSAKQKAPGAYTVKTAVSVRPGADSFIAKFSGNVAPVMALAPEKSVFAFAGALDGADLYTRLDRVFSKHAEDDVKNMYAAFLAQLQMEGIDLPALVSSFRGMGLFLEADPQKPLNFSGFTGVTLVLDVKDEAILNVLLTLAKQHLGENMVQNRRIAIPTPVGFMFTVYQHGNYLIATSDAVGMDARLTGSGKSLLHNPEYITAAAGMPGKYYQAFFCSAELGKRILPSLDPALLMSVSNFVDLPAAIRTFGLDKTTYGVAYRADNMLVSRLDTGSLPLALFVGSPLVQVYVNSFVSACMQGVCTSGVFDMMNPVCGDDMDGAVDF